MMMLVTAEGRRFFFRGQDLHTQYGFIRKEEIEKCRPGAVLKTNKGIEMTAVKPDFLDMFGKIRRSPQIIPLKDVGTIITETGIGKKSAVLDAGAGSGALCCYLANIAKKVYSYEIREDFLEIARKNAEFLKLKNVVIKHKDVYQGIDEKKLDVIILDLPEPWKAIEHAAKALKFGGYLVSYSPTLPQVSDFVEASRKKFVYLKTIEIIQRDWEIEERKIRPKSQAIGHSGFLSFCRKVRGLIL